MEGERKITITRKELNLEGELADRLIARVERIRKKHRILCLLLELRSKMPIREGRP